MDEDRIEATSQDTVTRGAEIVHGAFLYLRSEIDRPHHPRHIVELFGGVYKIVSRVAQGKRRGGKF